MFGNAARSTVPHRIRRRIGPTIDRLARRVGQPEYRVWPAGYVGTVSMPRPELEAMLHDLGFRWNPLSLFHYTLVGESSDGSWVYRPSVFADRQLHVVLYGKGSSWTDIYAHTEFSWIRHPLKHAKEEEIRRAEGAVTMRRMLEQFGVEYDRKSIVTRSVVQLADRVREAIRRPGSPF